MKRICPHRLIYAFTIVLSFTSVAAFPQAPAAHRLLAISIDDLPMVEREASIGTQKARTDLLMAALTKHKAKAIGFVNEIVFHGNKDSLQRVDLLREWLDTGMELGNHTYSHADYSTTPLPDFEQEILKGELITKPLLHERGMAERFFRYPYNHTGLTKGSKDSLEEFLHEHGYQVAPFTIEHDDYMFDKVYDDALENHDTLLAQKVKKAYLSFLDTAFSYYEKVSARYFGHEPPQVLLIHANAINTECLNEMLTAIERRGYSFISFEEALQDSVYKTPDDYVGKYGISWLHRWCVNKGIKMQRREEPDPPQFILDLYEKK